MSIVLAIILDSRIELVRKAPHVIIQAQRISAIGAENHVTCFLDSIALK